MLQSGLHKQHMKDLFVELCLTVPVRLSSLLPYLPMLMDPLVSALNGSQTLVSQGLRTLELCVDNLQPDFLYDHIQPVRAELMQVSLLLSPGTAHITSVSGHLTVQFHSALLWDLQEEGVLLSASFVDVQTEERPEEKSVEVGFCCSGADS